MTNKTLIKDAVALVTGASRGIGKDIVVELLENGASKVFAGVRKKNSISDLIEKYGNRIEKIRLDVTSQKDIDAAALKIQKSNILINNAG